MVCKGGRRALRVRVRLRTVRKREWGLGQSVKRGGGLYR
jgi:hypothetical protein